jgi:hypothetical protein
MGGEVRAGRRERGYEAAATACTGPNSRLGALGAETRRAHVEHAGGSGSGSARDRHGQIRAGDSVQRTVV